MAKTLNQIALFDVASEQTLFLISEFRQKLIKGVVPSAIRLFWTQSKSGVAKEIGTWHNAPDTLAAALLSLSGHGTAARIDDGIAVILYVEINSSNYTEVRGAVVHLLACEALKQLGPALHHLGGAIAVIGYKEPIPLIAAPGEEIGPSTLDLPSSMQSTVELDCRVLLGLCNGNTIKEAVASAKENAEQHLSHLTKEIASPNLDVETGWRHLDDYRNLVSAVSALDYVGEGSTKITK